MKTARIRITKKVWEEMTSDIRLGDRIFEGGRFLKCFWSKSSNGLVVVISEILQPQNPTDVVCGRSRITFKEPYVSEILSSAEVDSHAIGLIHSHPVGCPALPSLIDDDMDSYFSGLAQAFTPDHPYISLILSRTDSNEIDFSGRVLFEGNWLLCRDITIVDDDVIRIAARNFAASPVPVEILERLERLADGLGERSAEKLWNSKIGIIGGGGTGSAAFHSAIRSCFGNVVVIDPQRIAKSNAERVHGIEFNDTTGDEFPLKVDVLARFASRINPLIHVTAVPTDILSSEALSELVNCDVILGCTDSETGRLVVADLANRFLIPTINVNVNLHGGNDGLVKSQFVHVTRYGPDLPCPYCRDQVDARLLAQELMSEEERLRRQKLASQAPIEQRNSYWQDEPILPTVGSLTTIAGEFAVNAIVGLITRAFKPLKQFLQFNLLRPELEAVSLNLDPHRSCLCINRMGKAGQVVALTGTAGKSEQTISPPRELRPD